MSNIAVGLSEALAATIEALAPSVVRVEARRRPASGTVVSAHGHVVTSSHACEREEDVEVGLASGRALPARFLGRDPGTDVALLQIEAGAAPALAWGEAASLKVGHVVTAVARPYSAVRATAGIVSVLGEAGWRSPAGGRIERYLEIDADLPWGFSGGAVADAAGRALGMATSGLVRGAALVIPGATVARVVESIAAHGRVRRGFLGVGAYPVQLPPASAQEAGQGSGLLVVSVVSGTAAEKAGILLGDVLLTLDGKPVTQLGDLVAQLDEEKVGRELKVRLLRGGKALELALTVGVHP